MKIIVLGCGLVGHVIVRDLVDKGHEVKVVDNKEESFEALGDLTVEKTIGDLSKTKVIKKEIKDSELVVSAVPGSLGYNVVKTAISSSKNVIDISFCKEDMRGLHKLAEKKNVWAVVDCGVAPGLSNMMFAQLYKGYEQTSSLTCYVGGLPVVREKPFEYKVVFSFRDVLEEYTRPARFIDKGNIVIEEALSGVEEVSLEGVGTLEAFNSDGLRSLLFSGFAPNMIEKTLRYPGHAAIMKTFRGAGLLGEEPIEIGKAKVSPIDLTSKLLNDRLILKPKERDFTVLNVIGHGLVEEKPVVRTFHLLDFYDSEKDITSMARTTGYTCTSVIDTILTENLDLKKGVLFPEQLGLVPGFLEAVGQKLVDHKIKIEFTEENC